ncbi:MAG: GNAT family N-acetyltransferase [Nocardioidaceae bacterium]
MDLRPLDPSDHETVLALNQGALEGVGTLDLERLGWIAGLAEQAVLADDGGTVAGFAITIAPGTSYDSANYRWFGGQYDDFAYLDRIVVAPGHRRRGVATLLYDTLERRASGRGRMTLEVYAEPPNAASLAFHAARGYDEVGRLDQANGKKAAMLVKALG